MFTRVLQRRAIRMIAAYAGGRTIGRIRQALHAAHALGDTIVIYISDNGVLDGRHRIPSGKIVPYEKDLRQPLLIRVPHAYLGARRHAQVTSEAANVDIAPTILDLAGGQPCAVGAGCRTMDGRSLVPLLQGKTPPWTRGRAILTEYQRAGAKNAVCAYRGLELRQTSYVHYTSVSTSRRGSCDPADENELYNLSLDPWELRNLSPAALGSPAYR